MKFVILFVVALFTVSAMAQATPAPKPPVATETETLKLENFVLKQQNLQQQELMLEGQYNAFIETMNAEHPGYTFNRRTHAFEPIPVPTTATPVPVKN